MRHPRTSPDLLDIGTGGGEWLASLAHRPPRTVATEGWPPNVGVAGARLRPLRVTVVANQPAPDIDQVPDERPGRLPFPSDSFALVTSRHESFDASEIARVLVPDGIFLTQHVGSDYGDFYEALELLRPPAPQRRWGTVGAPTARRAVPKRAGCPDPDGLLVRTKTCVPSPSHTCSVSTVAPLFPIRDPARRAKGRRWMRALQRQIADAWRSTVETETRLCRKHGLEADAETAAISVALAATAIRVLDRTIFNDEYPRIGKTSLSSRYERFRDTDDDGRVVSGMTLIRNAEIHATAIIDANVERAVSIPGTHPTRFLVFPIWRSYRSLPPEVRELVKTRDTRRQARAYKSHLAGHLVMETLLDALSFLLRCDSSLASRAPDGELEYLPLPAIVEHEYERRHPDWPKKERVAVGVRSKAKRRLPTGIERVILHRLDGPDGKPDAYVGKTVVDSRYSEAFVERPEQIVADVSAGFPYKVRETRISVAPDGRLVADGDPLEVVQLPTPPANGPNEGFDRSEESWRVLLRLAEEDAFYYAQQRAS